MQDEDTHSIVIDIPKPRIYSTTSTHLRTQKKPKQVPEKRPRCSKSTEEKKLTLPNIKPLRVDNIVKEEVLLPYIRYSKIQEKEKFTKRLNLGLRESCKAVYTDLQNRIHTDDPENDCRAVTDFDPGFFTCVNETYLSSYIAPFKSLKYLFSSQLRWRQEVGYRNDCMLNIDNNFKKEQEVYNNTIKIYQQQVKYFDGFVSDDYRKSMLSLSKWEELKLEVHKQICEFQCLAAREFTITSRIVGLDYRYSLQQKYGRFLYYLSPPSWRFKNRNFARSIEIEAKGFDFGMSSEEDTFNVMFEKLKKECYSGLVKPVLYFKHPNDLMNLFDGIEQQHLHHFTHVVQLAPHAAFLKKGIKLYKDIIAQDSAGTLNTIKYFEKLLQFSQEQRSQLEAKFFQILHGLFYESVGALEVLKFHTHLEFCYEKIRNEKPINMDLFQTAKALEDFYMVYTKRLDAVTGDKIKAAMEQYVDSERRKYRKAKVAARELRLFDRLERRLLRAFAPAVDQPGYTFTIQRSSRKKLFSKSKYEEQKNSLTEAELEYLTLFTDWTEKEDPADYLQSWNLPSEETEQQQNT